MIYSYCIPIDDGAAPNPYWDYCTLTICKPVIRRMAKTGDWVVGVGSKNVDGKSYEGKLVYAMKVTHKEKMSDYDDFVTNNCPNKIPAWNNPVYERNVGDAIYDFSIAGIGQRLGVHGIKNKNTDLNGKFALISNHFYYFGDRAVDIPAKFKSIIKQGQGHKSKSNITIESDFINWIGSNGFKLNALVGSPQINVKKNKERSCKIRSDCAKTDLCKITG